MKNEKFDKQFILKHKNIDVLKFSFNDTFEIDNIIDIYTKEHIPLGISTEKDCFLKSFQKWWIHRGIPASRDKLQEGLALLNLETVSELLGRSYGVSLSDHYWIKPVNQNLEWDNINYYKNSFSDDVGKALFDNKKKYDSIEDAKLNSPDNSSDGNLRKKWIINNGIRYLIKGGDMFSPQESFNEVIAAELMNRLNINHAEYSVLHDEEKHVFYSKTPNFTTETFELINANQIISYFTPPQKKENPYDWFIFCCEQKGIKKDLFEKDLVQMFFIDYIIGNKDRHYRNFGFIRNSETLEWIGLAPVYDSGNSLFEGLADLDLTNTYFTDSKNIPSKPFAFNHAEQIKLLPIKKYCSELQFNNLKDFPNWVFDFLKQNYRLTDKRKELICQKLEERINEAKRLLTIEFTQNKSNQFPSPSPKSKSDNFGRGQ